MHGSKAIIDLGFADRLCKIIFMLVEFCSTKNSHEKEEEFTWNEKLDLDPVSIQSKTKNLVRFVSTSSKSIQSKTNNLVRFLSTSSKSAFKLVTCQQKQKITNGLQNVPNFSSSIPRLAIMCYMTPRRLGKYQLLIESPKTQQSIMYHCKYQLTSYQVLVPCCTTWSTSYQYLVVVKHRL